VFDATGMTVWLPAAESRHSGLYVLLLFLIYLFLTIPLRPIISKSTRLIFAEFPGLVELSLQMVNLKLVFLIHRGTLPWQPIFVSSAWMSLGAGS